MRPGPTTTLAVPAAARTAILAWFDGHGRRFPFRGAGDPYAILVSEAMAQQTQIARASETWLTFLSRFPTVEALAAAAPADVLRAWRGLGYNRRALSLWRAARVIVDEHRGRVPDEVAVLERLPGVGPYTARAVAVFGFGRRVGAVDTNVRRVLGRMVGGADQPSSRDLQSIADAAVPEGQPGAWTHALMDVGATFCRASRPDCARCPAQAWCAFAALKSVPGAAARRARPQAPFKTTSRWLRGRILDRLRDAQEGVWTILDAPIGEHDAAAVEAGLASLARDGLLDRHPTDPRLARLPPA